MIIGMDLSSRSIAAVGINEQGDPTVIDKIAIHASVTDRAHILGMLHHAVETLVFENDRVYVEAPVLAGARNIQSTIKVAAAYGTVLAAVNNRHATAYDVPISLWKLATQGKGNASKDDVSSWLHSQHPHVHRECAGDQDLIDAACIALYALAVEQERSLPAGVRERALLHQAPL